MSHVTSNSISPNPSTVDNPHVVQRLHRWFACIVLIHLTAWTALPTLLNNNLPLDVIEALAWGRQWQWGYDKHPPMSAWAAELAAMLGGRHDAALYLLSQLCIITTMWAIWRLALDLFDVRCALAAVMLMQGIVYMHFTSVEFNVNVIQMPFWALGFLFFHRAVHRKTAGGAPQAPGGHRRTWLLYWIGLGIVAAFAFLSKYLAVFMAAPMLLYMVLTPQGRSQWKKPGIYIALLVAIIICLPHLRWMIEHDFQTLRYGLRRAGGEAETGKWLDHVTHPLRFIFAQLIAVAAALVLWVLAANISKSNGIVRERKDHASRSMNRSEPSRMLYAWLIAVTPILAMASLSLCTGMRLRSMWGGPMVVAATLPLAAMIDWKSLARPQLRKALAAWLIVALLPLFAYAGQSLLSPVMRGKAMRTHFPGPALAQYVEGQWHERFPDQPFRIVIGDEWMAGNVSWYSDARPSVYLRADTFHAPWLNDEQVARHGAAVVWFIADEDQPEPPDHRRMVQALEQRFARLIEDEPVLLEPRTLIPPATALPRRKIGLAWIPPQRDE